MRRTDMRLEELWNNERRASATYIGHGGVGKGPLDPGHTTITSDV